MACLFSIYFIILITREAIFSVKGQCTVKGCDNGDPLISIVAEIQQLRVELFDQLNKQVQGIHELLNASLQEMKSQQTTANMSLQAVDICRRDQDIYSMQFQHIHEILNRSFQEMKSYRDTVETSLQVYIKQGQRLHELLNESFHEMKSRHDLVETSFKTVDQRLAQEHDIYIKQGQSLHELLNESFQEMKSQHHSIMISLDAIDQRRLQEQDIYIKQSEIIHGLLNETFQEMTSLQVYTKQGQSIHEILNESFQEIKSQQGLVKTSLLSIDRRLQEQDICIRQGQNIHELLNETFQDMKSHHDTVATSLQVYTKQGQSIHELLNETFQDMKSQHGTITTSLQTIDRHVLELNGFVKLGICSPARANRDCSEIKASGHATSGVYEVCVCNQSNPVCTHAYCDMNTNYGPSLVFQRRKDGSVNFNRTWTDYKQGFGNQNGEFWLGNEMLYLLTSRRNYKLRVELEDFTGNKCFAEYARFSISSSADKYRLTVSGYSGTAGDSMAHHNGRQFSTKDADNDVYKVDCAKRYSAAWWYGNCGYAHLNGIYNYTYNSATSEIGFKWYYWRNSNQYSLKASEMKLVPVS